MDYTTFMTSVLIVDDNEQNLYMLQVLLQTHGYEVVSAAHGALALEMAASKVPDLVISDILMPVMDGFSLCRHWKSDPKLKEKPFIFYTATYTEARDEEFALSLGADRFLIKPEEPERLLAIIAELLAPAAPSADAPPVSEAEFLKDYNIALFRKLEKKVSDLEVANAALQRDLVLRQALERQLVQAQKMESLGQITGGIVHDFNNVLTVIGGLASVIAQEKADPARMQEWSAKIQEAVRMGGNLGRQLLAFARKQDLSLTVLDMDGLLVESSVLLRAALPRTVELVVSRSADLPAVQADPIQLKQVLLNLVFNARDAISPPGKVTLDTAWVDLDEEFVRHRADGLPGRYVRIRCHDTGSGMDPETLEKIFEPFFTTKGPGRGSGLGLSVVYGIVRQHRGFVQVSSVVGRGTSFEVYLPALSSKK